MGDFSAKDMRAEKLFGLPSYEVEKYIMSRLNPSEYNLHAESIENFKKMFELTGIAKMRPDSIIPWVDKKIPRVNLEVSVFTIYYRGSCIIVSVSHDSHVIVVNS